ncbi:MAG: nicotinate phosphoribosyltransferase [Chloroflexota bacterium]|nr:nicotinate phosphoribosyltransferase [Chloroflexota bacterium]
MNQRAFHITRADLGLFTDLYELTMAQTYFEQGMFSPATFDLFFRSYPPNRGYLVCAGLEDVLDFLEGVSFGDGSREYLRETGMFTGDFLDFLGDLQFSGNVRALPEGRIFFANEPVLEVTAPMIEAQLVETLIINRLNFQSLQATKAARCVSAAQGRAVSDFGARRAPGIDSALTMARSGFISGFQSTSNVMAARRYSIPPAGTMAHSMITAFPTEVEAFRAYATAFPQRTILLLDTYDTIEGAHNAVQVGREMEARGQRLAGVRLDSGDYLDLSLQVRRILDKAGLNYVRIVASGGIDEYEIERLVAGGAPIDIFGVGTKVTTSADAPYCDMSYKLTCYDGRPVMKLSPEKVSPPGAKQIYRLRDSEGQFERDVITLLEENLPGGEALLETVMEGGRKTDRCPSLAVMRERFEQDFGGLDVHFKKLHNPPHYPVAFSPALTRLAGQVQGQILENLDSSGN